jgi:L-ribulose-5-phosphate 4-epimerase
MQLFNIHNLDLWNRFMHHVPTSSENISYGTPEMANEIKRLFDETTLRTEKKLVMGGHREGVISFGKDLDEAGNILINTL